MTEGSENITGRQEFIQQVHPIFLNTTAICVFSLEFLDEDADKLSFHAKHHQAQLTRSYLLLERRLRLPKNEITKIMQSW